MTRVESGNRNDGDYDDELPVHRHYANPSNKPPW